ncbi:MAG: hypothetical protein AAF529_19310 [Pseudomonadota bacterium]
MQSVLKTSSQQLWLTLFVILVTTPSVRAAEVNCTVSAFKRDCKEPLLEPHKDESRKSIKLEGKTITRELRQPTSTLPSTAHCQAEFTVSYMQMHKILRVETRIETDDCAAASGEYTLQVRTYADTDDGPEPITRLLTEPWQRSDAEPVATVSQYAMEGATRLGWVRVKSNPAKACICTAHQGRGTNP